ncbi:MAG: hypothetical protein AVDCRST_MAG38-1659 [uncultured Solirubrobacteraceae bacterium]|uniref:Uncharacterized protein n=1 Tax=uncultured Solirubrobacteraceae bacterium TaxID=1162706 RepID=A0A6J4RK57_9ACTN|nr:MAG: hypothetical protein AVDCRST_MAG38-1659 [uncultured Solirubrobacteraceae bacterium]
MRVGEAVEKLVGARPPVLAPLEERALDREEQRGGDPRAQLVQAGEPLVLLLVDHRVERLAPPRALPREHLPADQPQAVQVAPAVHREPVDLLGRHVRGGADGRAGHRELVVALEGPGDPEVGEQRAPRPLLEEDVLGLHVAVHHAGRVRVRQRRGHVAQDALGLVEGELGAGAEHLAQGAARHVLHDDGERPPLEARDRADAHDVRVVERRGGARLALEAAGDLRVLRELATDRLDGDRCTRRAVAGEVDERGRPAADLAHQLVARLERAQVGLSVAVTRIDAHGGWWQGENRTEAGGEWRADVMPGVGVGGPGGRGGCAAPQHHDYTECLLPIATSRLMILMSSTGEQAAVWRRDPRGSGANAVATRNGPSVIAHPADHSARSMETRS